MSETTTDAGEPATDAAHAAEVASAEAGSRTRTETGRVTSTAMQQTATVLVERRVRHPVYGKYVRRSKKYHVHDAENALAVGDTVLIRECRPISRTKSWTLDRVLERARD